MKSFRDYLSEEVLPSVQVADGGLDIEKPAVRAAINAAIAGVVSQPAVTPYVVFNRLSKLLAQYHIVLPKRFLEGDKGVEVFEIRQFGHKMGMTDSGEFINHVPSTHYLFLQYGIISPFGVTYAKPVVGGMFKVTARLVDKVELDQLLDMAEISLKEGAEEMKKLQRAVAPKEEMHSALGDCDCNSGKSPSTQSAISTMMRKKDRKLSADSLSEEMSHDARELATYADNHAQLHRSSHQPIVKNLSRKHAKGTYDHGKAEKLWGYHAKRAADSYHKEHGHKFSVSDRKEAARHMANSARDEHGFGSVKEEQIDELSYETVARYHRKAADRYQTGEEPYKKREKGRELATRKRAGGMMGIPKAKVMAKEETLDEKAPPGAKFERMVKHIKKGYSKDGLTAKEKSIAYATAWKAKKREEGE